MKTCIPGCEFMLRNYCNLHDEYLDCRAIENGKVAYLRCKECEEEKEELDIIEDLKVLEELYENTGISDVAENGKRKRLLREIDAR